MDQGRSRSIPKCLCLVVSDERFKDQRQQGQSARKDLRERLTYSDLLYSNAQGLDQKEAGLRPLQIEISSNAYNNITSKTNYD